MQLYRLFFHNEEPKSKFMFGFELLIICHVLSAIVVLVLIKYMSGEPLLSLLSRLIWL